MTVAVIFFYIMLLNYYIGVKGLVQRHLSGGNETPNPSQTSPVGPGYSHFSFVSVSTNWGKYLAL